MNSEYNHSDKLVSLVGPNLRGVLCLTNVAQC